MPSGLGELSSISKRDGNILRPCEGPYLLRPGAGHIRAQGPLAEDRGPGVYSGSRGAPPCLSPACLADSGRHGADVPSRIHLNNRSAPRLSEAVRILEYLDVPMSYHLCKSPALNDRIVESLPAGSLSSTPPAWARTVPAPR